MEPRQGSGTTTIDGADLRAELLGRLGLPADASDADVATAHRAALALLEHAPEGQREWAEAQLADVEAITSLLADLGPTAPTGVAAGTATGAGRRRPGKLVWVVAGVVLLVGAAFGVHAMSSAVPGITGTPDASTTGTAAPIDQARVGALMQKITANPKDVASLNELASIYFQAGDYKSSATFSQKVVAVDPKNDTAWVALGAAQFNQVDQAGAKASWLKAIAVNPKNAEAHYDLGFLYLSGDKPDVTKAKAEWATVIAIDPKSDLAKTVQTHLASLTSASASPSASSGS
ncbi:MAG: tetratricopeptide repeat protein [Actinomycetales bacterium]|nr:tetratricopeptide repeat protein [Actinomycetales bacterium]